MKASFRDGRVVVDRSSLVLLDNVPQGNFVTKSPKATRTGRSDRPRTDLLHRRILLKTWHAMLCERRVSTPSRNPPIGLPCGECFEQKSRAPRNLYNIPLPYQILLSFPNSYRIATWWKATSARQEMGPWADSPLVGSDRRLKISQARCRGFLQLQS
jgi:hypothetical protein